MRKRNFAILYVVVGTVAACASAASLAQSRFPAPLRGGTYESLRDLPDWTGWWHLVPADPARGGHPPLLGLLGDPPAPLLPKLLPQVRNAIGGMLGHGGRDYCGPPRFVGFQNGDGFEDTIELLFTPGRVTLTNEAGLIRRIYTDGRALPEQPDETHTGTSVGRWEGDTLVVETVGLTRSSRFPLELPGAPAIGAHARVVERIALEDRDTLVIDSELTAPELLTAAYRIRTTYVREPGYVGRELDYCVDSDRLVEPETRALRFDLTPPADLPPPE
ncbi:MAG TPA: hypothetical protein VFO94_09790 [Gammaproteobacteria bacterium]|nr:hypothetical protein [Gammaproteobacteria bacterium]